MDAVLADQQRGTHDRERPRGIGADGTAALAWIERDLRNPPAAWVAVRPPGADFGAPIQLGLGEDVAVAAGPGGTTSVVWNGEGGLAYGVIGRGAAAALARIVPGTAGGRQGRLGVDAAGNATIAFRTINLDAGVPAFQVVTVRADGSVSAPQALHDGLPDDGWDIRVAPGGQAAVSWPGMLAYRPTATGPFEPSQRVPSEGWGGHEAGMTFDAAGIFYMTVIESPVNGGDETFRVLTRPAGGVFASSPREVTNRLLRFVAVDPAGGAQVACDCGTDGGLHTRTVFASGAVGPLVKERDQGGRLLSFEIAPDGTRLGLWQSGPTVILGSRPPAGAWTAGPLVTGAAAGLGVGPFGELIVPYADADGRLRVLASGAAPVRGATGAGGGTAGTPAALPARVALAALVKRLRSGIAADRRRIARRRTLAPARRDAAALRNAVRAVTPDSAATRRARTALVRGADRRARALRARRTRSARRLLTLAARDARLAGSRLR